MKSTKSRVKDGVLLSVTMLAAILLPMSLTERADWGIWSYVTFTFSVAWLGLFSYCNPSFWFYDNKGEGK